MSAFIGNYNDNIHQSDAEQTSRLKEDHRYLVASTSEGAVVMNPVPGTSLEAGSVLGVSPNDLAHGVHGQTGDMDGLLLHGDHPAIEAENYWDDTDSAMGDDESIVAKTLDSAIRNHVWENGHRYHAYKAGTYLYPNDDTELHREDMKDRMTQLMLRGRLVYANFSRDPMDALDLGTGTGKWALEFAEEFPGCRVLAVDLSPVQPNMTPPNLEFQVDDIENEWTYQEDSFDYIHIRYMASAIRDWTQLIDRCYRTLRQGGIIEMIDMDLNYTSDDATVGPSNRLRLFFNQLISAMDSRGVRLTVAPELPMMLQLAGFSKVLVESPKLPMGWWPRDARLKEIGIWQHAQFMDALHGIAMGAFTKILGWTPEQVELMLVGVREDIKDQRIHGYWRNYFVCAEKPGNTGEVL